jgi:phthalate 4,5-cis-dihydrodiol dehydrogenase
MIAACSAANVYLIVGHSHSFDTPYLRTRELIRDDCFGAVKMIQAINYTDYLYRPRRPEELQTAEGGGAVFSQAAHQVDIVRMLVDSPAVRLRASVGRWDPSRPTEGAYSALIWFKNGAYASLSYSGYGHFNSDEWTHWIGEMGERSNPDAYGSARRRLGTLASWGDEGRLKAAGTYGGSAYRAPANAADEPLRFHQHFGPLIVSCEHADVRPLPDSIIVYGDQQCETLPLERPVVPRAEVIDELYAAVVEGLAPMHDGQWAQGTLEICLAILKSSEIGADVLL